jgi:hypothetical protein
VLRIHEILVRIRIHGSIPLTNGSGGDPAIFVSVLQDVNKKLLKVHLHHFSKIKSHKEVTKQ